MDKLDHYIESLLKEKLLNSFMNHLTKLTAAQHFLSINEDMKYDQAIRLACNILYKEGLIPENFADLCIEREDISSTNYKDIAIPHPAQSIAYENAIFIMHNNRHFLWNNGARIKTILLLVIRKEDVLQFKPVFDFISLYLSDRELTGLFSDADSYETFIGSIISYLNRI